MESSVKEHSVYQTVTKMCRHLARSCSHDSLYTERVAKRMRSLAFETLLFKCNALSSCFEKCNGTLEEESDTILGDILFQACQDSNKNPVYINKTKNILNVVKKMNELLQENPELARMLKFLLLMANNETVDKNELEPLYGLDLRKYDFLDPLCWKTSYNTQLYQFNNELLEKRDSRFKTITTFPFNEELGSGLQYKEYFVVPSNKEDARNWSYKNLKDFGFDDWTPPPETEESLVKAPNSDDGYVTPDRDISEDTKNSEDISSKPRIQWSQIYNMKMSELRTWENLGGIYTEPELPFISVCKESTIHLYNLTVNRISAMSPQLTNISIDKFKLDVVRLLFGLDSETFFYDKEKKTFVLQAGIYLDGISPNTLQDLCNDFITCANNYYILSNFLQHDSDSLNLTRRSLVFEALCNCLLHYVRCYRGVVLRMSRKLTLIEGCNWIQTLKNQLTFLIDFCCLKTSQEFSGLPLGGALLAYVYNYLCQVTRKDITCILYYILESCCNVYFRFLEKWIFEGVCEDQCGEFFVEPKGIHELPQNRQYWSRGFAMNKRLVPLFLSGLESDIFICGKYMRLLKLCKPNDPLFSCLQSGYPSIVCCLDQQSVNKLMDECESFKKRCISMCGASPVIISDALSEEQKESYYVSLKEQRDRTLEKIKKDQEAKRKLQAENKRIMFEALKKDMEEARTFKIQEEKNRIKQEEKMLMEARRLDILNELRIQEEREKLIQYYSELSASVDIRKREAELELKKFKNLEAKLMEDQNSGVDIQLESDSATLETAEKKSCTKYETQDLVITKDNDIHPTHATGKTVIEGSKYSTHKKEYFWPQGELTKLKSENLPEECLSSICHSDNEPEINYISKTDESEPSENKIISEEPLIPEFTTNRVNKVDLEGRKKEILTNVSTEKSGVRSDTDLVTKDRVMEEAHMESCSESVLRSLTDNKIVEHPSTQFHCKTETEGALDAHKIDMNKIPWYNGGYMFKNNQFNFDKNPIIVNITERILGTHSRKTMSDVKQIPMATVNQAINKSVMVPLKIQLSLANDAILRLFINEHNLITHLDCLRKYFFLLDGEYSHYLKQSLFTGIQKVSKPSLLLTYFNLNSLLRCAVRNTSVEDCTERLSFLVKDVPTAFHLTDPKVLDCLSLQYRIHWPINIIITSEALVKYDQVFNFVMQLHRALWVLEQEIHILKIKMENRSLQYRQVQLYRHVMTQFVRAWLNYISSTALEDCWIKLKHNLQKADNIDRIYAMHVHYIKSVTFRCLLNKQSKVINSYLLELLHTVFKFNEVLKNGEWVEGAGGGELQHTAFSHLSHEYGNFLRLSRYLYKYIQRLVSIGYQSHLDRLLVLLSGNDFYKVKC